MSDIQTIIQGGAVGVAVLMIIVNFMVIKMFLKTINNHLSHLDSTLRDLNKTMGVIASSQENIAKISEDSRETFKKTNWVLDRLDRKTNGK